MESFLTVWHTAYIIIFLPTVIGNGLIILSIIRYNSLRTRMHLLIGNLAFSDLTVGLFLIPCDFMGDLLGLNKNKVYCLFTLSLFVVTLGGSSVSLLLLSIERLLVIAYPFTQHRWLTKSKLACALTAGWIYVLANGIPPLLGWNRYTSNQTHCDGYKIHTREYQYVINGQYFVILICNIVLYALVMRIAVKSARSMQLREGRITRERSTKDFQKLKMMAIVLGLFIICWCPQFVVSSISAFYRNDSITMARRYSLILGVVNSSLNWLVYGFRNRDFRTAFKEIIKCQRKTSNFSSGSGSRAISVISSSRKHSVDGIQDVSLTTHI